MLTKKLTKSLIVATLLFAFTAACCLSGGSAESEREIKNNYLSVVLSVCCEELPADGCAADTSSITYAYDTYDAEPTYGPRDYRMIDDNTLGVLDVESGRINVSHSVLHDMDA